MVYSVTVGETIKFLSMCKPNSVVEIDPKGYATLNLNSWRGSYEHLSISPTHDEKKVVTADQLCKSLSDMIGKHITGYKGGTYIVTGETSLYADEWGSYTDHRLIGGCEYKDRVVIHVEYPTRKSGWEHFTEY